MHIAQVAPLVESVPPQLYGGTERIISYLTEALVDLGHDVTLFASGDSKTRATLRPACARALRLAPQNRDLLALYMRMLEDVAACAPQFDVIHFHCDWVHVPLFRRLGVPFVTTLHGRLDLPDLDGSADTVRRAPFVSISEAQRSPQTELNWVGTIHHGLPLELLRPSDQAGRYLAFLGRIAPEKGPHVAIRLAQRAGVPLKIAAKIDRADETFYREAVQPLLRGSGVEFIGEIDEAGKSAFLGEALALLFPIDWPEPFGLVMIEAMACGTPVIAFRRGSVPEIIEDGLTGFVVDVGDEAGALAAIEKAAHLDRRRIRREFERRFSAKRMAQDYIELYQTLTLQPRLRTVCPLSA